MNEISSHVELNEELIAYNSQKSTLGKVNHTIINNARSILNQKQKHSVK